MPLNINLDILLHILIINYSIAESTPSQHAPWNPAGSAETDANAVKDGKVSISSGVNQVCHQQENGVEDQTFLAARSGTSGNMPDVEIKDEYLGNF